MPTSDRFPNEYLYIDVVDFDGNLSMCCYVLHDNLTRVSAYQYLHCCKILFVSFCLAVDVLETVGVRQSQDGVTTAIGPNGLEDAFALTRMFSGQTIGREWELIGIDFNTQFGVYIAFQAGYNGSLLEITDGSQTLFYISLIDLGDLTAQLTVTLPGLTSVNVNIPTSPDGMYQFIGIKLQLSRLVIIVNCTVEAIIPLEGAPEQLEATTSSIAIFNQPATVCCDCHTER